MRKPMTKYQYTEARIRKAQACAVEFQGSHETTLVFILKRDAINLWERADGLGIQVDFVRNLVGELAIFRREDRS